MLFSLFSLLLASYPRYNDFDYNQETPSYFNHNIPTQPGYGSYQRQSFLSLLQDDSIDDFQQPSYPCAQPPAVVVPDPNIDEDKPRRIAQLVNMFRNTASDFAMRYQSQSNDRNYQQPTTHAEWFSQEIGHSTRSESTNIYKNHNRSVISPHYSSQQAVTIQPTNHQPHSVDQTRENAMRTYFQHYPQPHYQVSQTYTSNWTRPEDLTQENALRTHFQHYPQNYHMPQNYRLDWSRPEDLTQENKLKLYF